MDGFLQFSRVYGYNLGYPTISDDSMCIDIIFSEWVVEFEHTSTFMADQLKSVVSSLNFFYDELSPSFVILSDDLELIFPELLATSRGRSRVFLV